MRTNNSAAQPWYELIAFVSMSVARLLISLLPSSAVNKLLSSEKGEMVKVLQSSIISSMHSFSSLI